ncbi:growth arrest-specific protein 6-like [Leptopilina heterotoma]|uniref:growth arrest-specific protein 6-like n=1 Tax=Leptopilina heterotoma TaxID=63436 RepID=UPI001CA8BA36|nr:growth arrest-specific protein 6-like [Leptopilina heterotoma]
MRSQLILIIGMIEISFAELQTTTTEREANTGENDVDLVPTMEQIFDPNIKLLNSGKIDTDEEVDEDERGDISRDKMHAVRDVAYFLRRHKFHDYDRRYYRDVNDVSRRLYEEFPKPPLKILHWEVHKECETSFVLCLKYLQRIASLSALRREDDTVTIMLEHNWTLPNNTQQINITQSECERKNKSEDQLFEPFKGPIERFQWRTSASYYMCWYTMLRTPELTHFGEPCDNHADCLGIYGTHNKDPRADDKNPFACAIYSFCPDACCPMKYFTDWKKCFQSKNNPCYVNNSPNKRECKLSAAENQDFEALMRNEINVTCHCQKSGYEWSSRYGICIDVDECTTNKHNCSLSSGESCFNLPGHFDCLCQFGYIYNSQKEEYLEARKR